MKVLQFTDLHLLANADATLWGTINPHESLCRVLQDARTLHGAALFAILTGDLVEIPEPVAYRLVRDCMSKLAIPVYRLPGNHDDPTLMDEILDGANIKRDRTFCEGNWHFILLNSAVPDEKQGYLSASELVFLADSLKAYPDYHTLICVHHHPVPIMSPWMDAMRLVNPNEFFEILDSHPQVKGVLWGHIHQEFHRQRHGVHLIGTPSTCIQFKPESEQFEIIDLPPAYRWFDLHADGRFTTGVRYIAR